MSIAPNPAQIFDRSVNEGERRLDQSLLALTSTSFIAGFTIVFGIAAMGIVRALIGVGQGGVAEVAGALAFSVGLVFLIVGRAELFSENFFDPAATVFDTWHPRKLLRLARLWIITFLLNLAGGASLILVMPIDGVLSHHTGHQLTMIAEDIVGREAVTGLASAFLGGALVSLLSFLLMAVNSVGSRIALAVMAGFLLTLGPFDHVVVAVLHVFFGLLLGAEVGVGGLFLTMGIATAGNLVGGLGLTTLTHIAQAQGARQSGE